MVGATAMLAPVFVEVALTLGLLFWMGYLRVGVIRSGLVRTRDVALREPNWPPHVLRVANAYENQFQLPVLFYLVSMLALFTGEATVLLAVLAWLFVVSRLLHTLVHVTTNNMARRFLMFAIGAGVLTVMWLVFAVQLLFGA